jgi:hypothetical protein
MSNEILYRDRCSEWQCVSSIVPAATNGAIVVDPVATNDEPTNGPESQKASLDATMPVQCTRLYRYCKYLVSLAPVLHTRFPTVYGTAVLVNHSYIKYMHTTTTFHTDDT